MGLNYRIKILLCILIFLLSTISFSQQLYISNIGLHFRDEDGNGSNGAQNVNDPYCSSTWQDISHDPRVDFITTGGNIWAYSSLIEFEKPRLVAGQYTYPNSCLKLCVTIQCVVQSTPSPFGIDDLTFEIFKFGQGANPLDPSSTPPIRTISMYNIGMCNGVTVGGTETIGTFCTAWDGSYNLDGMFAKRNGHYGFRARVRTNQVSPTAGNISIEHMAAFPGQNQIPIQMDVTNIHTVTTAIRYSNNLPTGIDIKYRLSKDAFTTITIKDLYGNVVRNLITSELRHGEGVPDGTITNVDFWDIRDNNGNLVPLGNYIIQIEAFANDTFGTDYSYPVSISVSISTNYFNVKINDINIKNLGIPSTDYANINFRLTDNATVYLDIFSFDTTFDNINCSTRAASGACGPNGFHLNAISTYTQYNQLSNIIWDGKDINGNYLCDGSYVFALSAVNNYGIWTNNISTGLININRGNVLKEFNIVPTLNINDAFLHPIYFDLELKRPSKISFKVLNKNGNTVKTFYLNENFSEGEHNITWDGKNNDGIIMPKGEYIAELVTIDTYGCDENKLSTHTLSFNFDPFRIFNLNISTLSINSPSIIRYNVSEPMKVVTKIYHPNTIFVNDLPICSKGNGDENCLIKVLISSANQRGEVVSIFDHPYLNTDKYVYKIFASTDINEIDENGNCIEKECKSLIDDVLIGEIPVERLFIDDLDISIVKDIYSENNYINYSFNLNEEANVIFEVYNSSHQKIHENNLNEVVKNQNNYSWDFKISSDIYLNEGNYYLKLTAQKNDKFDVIASTNFYFNPYQIYDFQISSNAVETSVTFKLKTFAFSNIFYEIIDESDRIVYKNFLSNKRSFDFSWNGRDLNGLRLKNGNYKLKLHVVSLECNNTDVKNCNLKYSLNINFILERPEITVIDNKVPVNESKEILIVMPDKEINIQIPPQTFSQEVNIKVSTSSLTKIGGIFDNTVIPLNFTFEINNDKGEQPKKPVKFYIDYNESDFDNIDESKLVVTRYVPENGRWVILKSKVYPEVNRIETETDHFSTFNVSQLVPSNTLSNLRIYPNPFNPLKHLYGMKFTGLPAVCKIKIFSISGELVKNITCDGSGVSIWDGRSDEHNILGSGIYIVYISSNFGEKKTKIIIEK